MERACRPVGRASGRNERPWHDRGHADQVEVVDTRLAQCVIEGRERRQAFGAARSEMKGPRDVKQSEWSSKSKTHPQQSVGLSPPRIQERANAEEYTEVARSVCRRQRSRIHTVNEPVLEPGAVWLRISVHFTTARRTSWKSSSGSRPETARYESISRRRARQAPQAAGRSLQRRQGQSAAVGEGQGRPHHRHPAGQARLRRVRRGEVVAHRRFLGRQLTCAPQTRSCATSKERAFVTSSAIPARPNAHSWTRWSTRHSSSSCVCKKTLPLRQPTGWRKQLGGPKWSTFTPDPVSRRRCRPSTWQRHTALPSLSRPALDHVIEPAIDKDDGALARLA